MKKKLIILLILNLILFSIDVIAQADENIFIITLNYKKQLFVESLSLVDVSATKGSLQESPFEPVVGYKLEMLSFNKEVLKLKKFSIPTAAVMLKGFGNINAQGSADDLNFTISVPYFDNAKLINIYDKDNNKVLEIPLSIASNLSTIEIEGELEVYHSDDFEDPENSRFDFYLISGDKRYLLESDKQLPVVLSGTLAKVKGKILDNKILVEYFELENLGKQLPQSSGQLLQSS